MNCTECISWVAKEKRCARGIKVAIPERTICRFCLKHTVVQLGERGGGERHYLTNAEGRSFDITDQIMRKAKKEEGDEAEK